MLSSHRACGSSTMLSSRVQLALPRLTRLVAISQSIRASVRASSTDDSKQYDYDLFTIGAGSGGVRASRMTSQHGKKVAVCEMPFSFVSSDKEGGVGGTCVLRGCVPKKLMVYASEYADEFRDAVGFGWDERKDSNHNWTHFMEAKRKELLRLNGAYKNTLNNAKVDLLEGRGKVVDAHTVDVDGKKYTARNILIAVGGRANRLPIPGAELGITSDEILELAERPKKLTVIGGGYIALEFSGIFRRFGTEVHTIFRQKLPLRGFDEEVRNFLNEQFLVSGLQLHPESTPVECKKQDDGRITVVYKQPDGSTTEIKDNDCVLFATGRSPNTKNLGLEAAGVKLGEKGEVVVDEYCRTDVPSIYALGDVINRIQLTPVALMEGMALAKTIGQDKPTKPEYDNIPSAVFCHPNFATVGLTEEQAAKKYSDVDIFTSSFRGMRNTISGSPLKNFMKLIVDTKTDRVIGAHMAGEHSAEIMQGFAVAIKAGVTKAVVDSTVGIHPSSAEEFVTLRSVTRQIRGGKVVEKK